MHTYIYICISTTDYLHIYNIGQYMHIYTGQGECSWSFSMIYDPGTFQAFLRRFRSITRGEYSLENTRVQIDKSFLYLKQIVSENLVIYIRDKWQLSGSILKIINSNPLQNTSGNMGIYLYTVDYFKRVILNTNMFQYNYTKYVIHKYDYIYQLN